MRRAAPLHFELVCIDCDATMRYPNPKPRVPVCPRCARLRRRWAQAARAERDARRQARAERLNGSR